MGEKLYIIITNSRYYSVLYAYILPQAMKTEIFLTYADFMFLSFIG